MTSSNEATHRKLLIAETLEVAIRVGLTLVLVFWCFQIIRPFIVTATWGVIIAIMVHPFYIRVEAWLKGRRWLAASLVTVLGLVFVVLPTLLLTETLVEGVEWAAQHVEGGELRVPPPPDGVKEWPLVGGRLHDVWNQASSDPTGTLAALSPHLKKAGALVLAAAGEGGFGLLEFVFAIIIAGALLAKTESVGNFATAMIHRIFAEKGQAVAELVNATLQSVTRGIVGVAVIQALLAGIAFYLVEVPAAGLWALLCLVLSAVQLGVLPVVLPVALYVFYTASTGVFVVFLAWSLFVGTIDNVLRPILLGKGVDVPMIVIFVGAIGGLIASGIIGMFVGSVVIVLGYKLLCAWVQEDI